MKVIWSRRWLMLAAVVVFGASSGAFAQAVSYTATLSGLNEVPANASTNTGNTFVTVDAATGVVTWNTASSIPQTSATGHHIHRGAAGANGPIVVNFGTSYTGSITATTALAAEIVGNPAGFYVNLHTAAFPGGELRAQLVPLAVAGSVPALGLPLLGLLGVALAGLGVFVVRRSKRT
jgi:CHRD domain